MMRGVSAAMLTAALLCAPAVPSGATDLPPAGRSLFDHLTSLEGVRSSAYRLEYHGRWEVDFEQIERAPADTRALRPPVGPPLGGRLSGGRSIPIRGRVAPRPS